MRVALTLIALCAATAVAAGAPRTPASDAQRVCRDRIEQVRQAEGLPKLGRDHAGANDPLLIAAVDKRLGGCSVMVMRNNLADVRPLPEAPGGPLRLQKIQ